MSSTCDRHPGPSRRRVLLGAGALGLVAVAGCGVQTDPLAGTNRPAAAPSPTTARAAATRVTVGAGSFTGSLVVAHLYAAALSHRGVAAQVIGGLGSPDSYVASLDDPSIMVLPAYTGDLLRRLDPTSSALTGDEIATALKPVITEHRRRLLKTSTAADSDVYCVTAKLSSQTGVISLATLPKIAKTGILGIDPDLVKASYGPAGLKQVYGAAFAGVGTYVDDTTRVNALLANRIQVACFRSTQTLIPDHQLVQLADPEQMIMPRNIVPVVQDAVAENGIAVAAINAVQSALSTPDLIALSRAVDAAPSRVAKIAAQYLTRKNLD